MKRELSNILEDKEISEIARSLSNLWNIPYKDVVVIVNEIIRNPELIKFYYNKRGGIVNVNEKRIPYGILEDIYRRIDGIITAKNIKLPNTNISLYDSWKEINVPSDMEKLLRSILY